ncbi:MAG: hypothetical protein OEM49_02965 [Myxococcales bacterium]|nr:hypothetical protein [Myxococcales bacterium]MDH5307325.1 hypothetical protein [Myxococcales bacterium]MDH5566054.1 hypothetical protein [Myxococcales bacterium]
MAQSFFEFVADQLEEISPLDKLEARGTVRLALKAGGLDPRSITKEQMIVVLQKVLPGELKTRGVDRADGLCEQIVARLKAFDPQGSLPAGESPEDVFRRLGN